MAARITLHVDGDLSALQKELDKLKRKGLEFGKLNARNFQQPLGKIRGELGQFDKSLAASNARVLAFGASAGAVYAVQRAFAEMIKQTIAVEKSMAEINVILGASKKELASFGNELFAIASKTGKSFQEVAEAGSELARQGLSMEQTLKRTADAMMLARLGGMDVADAVNSITAALNGFNAAGLSSTSVIDKIIAVDQAFAVSAADLAEGLKRVGNTAQDAGVGFDQLMGIITAVQQKTARGGAVIGNALKTIFTRIQRPKVLESLNQLGVATTNASGAQLDAMSIMKNLAGTYDKLAGAQKAQIAELIGGVFQVNILKASLADLSAQYSVYGNATAVAGRASGEAEMRNASLNKTLSAALNETMQNVAKLAATMGKLTMEPAIKTILNLVNKITGVADSSDAEGQGSKIGEGILKGIGKFLSGPGLMLAGVALFQLFNNLRKFAGDALRTFSGLNATFNQQKSTQQQINQLLQANPAMLKKIESGELSIQQAGQMVLDLYRAQEKSLMAQERLAANVAAAMAKARGGGGGGGKKGGAKLATGYVPNFEGGGEVAAMGAAGYKQGDLRNPGVRTQKVYDGQGGSFLADVNRREKTNTVVGANGHKGTFVAPPKDSVAGKKFEQRIKKQLALGYYPNFAKKAPPAGAGGRAGRGALVQPGEGRGPRKGAATGNVNIQVDIDDKIAIISTAGGAEDMAGMVNNNFLPETLGVKIPKDKKSGVGVAKIGIRGVTSQTPGQLKDGEFDEIAEKRIGKALRNMAKDIMPKGIGTKVFPEGTAFWNAFKGDESGYPQTAGRLFEGVVKGILGEDSSNNATWDHETESFTKSPPTELLKSVFGADGYANLTKAIAVDSKRSPYSAGDTASSIANKIKQKDDASQKIRQEIEQEGAKALKQRVGTRGKARGFIPNFSALGDAIGREQAANTTRSAIRVGTDKKLAGGHNPLGIGVTNTRDEPRGLKDVLGMGYIPNFARMNFNTGGTVPSSTPVSNPSASAPAPAPKSAPGLVTHVKNTTGGGVGGGDAKTADKLGAAQNKMFGAMMLASVATSMFAANTEKSTTAMKNTAAAVNGLTQGLMAVTTILMLAPGPIGIAIAAVVGIGIAVYSFVSNMDLASKALSAQTGALTELKETYAKQGSALQRMQQAISEESAERAKAKPSAKRIRAAQDKQAALMGQLSAATQGQLRGAGTSGDKQEVLAKAQSENARRGKAAERGEKESKDSEMLVAAERREAIMDVMKTTLIAIGVGVAGILVIMAAQKAMKAVEVGKEALMAGATRGQAVTSGLTSLGGAKFAGALTKMGSAISKALPFLGTLAKMFSGGLLAGMKALGAVVGLVILKAGLIVAAFEGVGRLFEWIGKKMSDLGGPFKFIGDKIQWIGDKMKVFSNVKKLVGGWMELRKQAKAIADHGNEMQDPEDGVTYTKEGEKRAQEAIQSTWDALDLDKFQKEIEKNPGELARIQREGTKFNEETGLMDFTPKGQQEMTDFLVRMGMDAETAAQKVKLFGNDTTKLTSALEGRMTQIIRDQGETKRLTNLADLRAAAEAALAAAVAKTTRLYEEQTTAMFTMAKGMVANKRTQKTQERERMMQMAKGGSKLASQFQTPEDQARQQFAIKNLEIGETFRRSSDKVKVKGGRDMMKLVTGNEEIAKILTKAGSDPAAKDLNNSLKQIAIRAEQGSGAGATGADIKAAFAKFKKAGGGDQLVPLQKNMLKVLGEQSTAMGQAEGTRKHMLRMSQVQTQLAQAQNQINREKMVGGGLKAFMDPAALDKQEDKFNDSLKRFQKAGARGDTVTQGRASGELLTSLTEFMGGSSNAPWAEGMKDVLEKGLATDLRSRGMARADVLEQAGRASGDQTLLDAAAELRGMDFDAAAKTQVAMEHKRKQMPANIAKLVSSQNDLAVLQQKDLDANVRTAGATAKMAEELVPGFLAGVEKMLKGGAFGADVVAGGNMDDMTSKEGKTKKEAAAEMKFKQDITKRGTLAADLMKNLKSGKTDRNTMEARRRMIAQLQALDVSIGKFTSKNKGFKEQVDKAKGEVASLTKLSKTQKLDDDQQNRLDAAKATVKMGETYAQRGKLAAGGYGKGSKAGAMSLFADPDSYDDGQGHLMAGDIGKASGMKGGIDSNLGLSAMLMEYNKQKMMNAGAGPSNPNAGGGSFGGNLNYYGSATAEGAWFGGEGDRGSVINPKKRRAQQQKRGATEAAQQLLRMQEESIQSAAASGTDVTKYRSGEMQGKFQKTGQAGEKVSELLQGRLQDTMQMLQGRIAEGRQRNRGALAGDTPEARKARAFNNIQMERMVIQLEMIENAMAKVKSGEMLGGQGAGQEGAANEAGRQQKMIKDLFSNMNVNNNIQVVIPAEVSLTGKEEVFKLKRKVEALQVAVGNNASNAGGQMP